MHSTIIEADYPLTFREEGAKELGKHIKNRQSVVLIGMKRVGISNFLRFFIYHQNIVKTFIGDNEKHLFIPVDLNDLVERELFPFWMLTLKRIADRVEHSDLNPSIKKEIELLFLDSIQSKDLFLLIDCIRRSLIKILEANILPTIFFIRFDRMRHHATKEFLYNLEGLKSATNGKLTYVFTTYRRLDHLSPKVFNLSPLSLASNNIYFKPASQNDLEVISETYLKRYNLQLSSKIQTALYELSGGFVQYIQLGLIILNENQKPIGSKEELFNLLVQDERITLQSEELWESLKEREQDVLIKVCHKQDITEEEKDQAKYLWDTGLVLGNEVFSPIFAHYLKQQVERKTPETSSVEFSKKEHTLFSFLKQNLNQICERESIIEAVWPEEEVLGVSDWAIDRLVARVRNKLKKQNSEYEIVTVKTRGYKLISSI